VSPGSLSLSLSPSVLWNSVLNSLTCTCCHLSHTCTPCLLLVIFQVGSNIFYNARLRATMSYLFLCLTGMVVHHHAWLVAWDGVFLTFSLGWSGIAWPLTFAWLQLWCWPLWSKRVSYFLVALGFVLRATCWPGRCSYWMSHTSPVLFVLVFSRQDLRSYLPRITGVSHQHLVPARSILARASLLRNSLEMGFKDWKCSSCKRVCSKHKAKKIFFFFH
jgi:hypothetical protein